MTFAELNREYPLLKTLALSAGAGWIGHRAARAAKRRGGKVPPVLGAVAGASLPLLYQYLTESGAVGNEKKTRGGAFMSTSEADKAPNRDSYIARWQKGRVGHPNDPMPNDFTRDRLPQPSAYAFNNLDKPSQKAINSIHAVLRQAK